MNTQMDDLLRKIRALDAKARKTNNEHEAATFAAKVQELLEKHNLSVDVLREQATERFGGVKGDRVRQKGWGASPYRRMLVGAVCELYYCRALYYKHTDEFMIIGKPVNVIVAKQMIEYLLGVVLRASRDYGATTNKAKLDFRRGMIIRLSHRLTQMLAEKQREERMREGNNPGNLPALYANQTALVESFLEDMGIKTKTARKIKVDATEAYFHGDAKGRTVSLDKQIGAK